MPIKLNKPERTKVPGIFRDGKNRYLVRARTTDFKTGRRTKKERIVTGTLQEAVLAKLRLEEGDESAKAQRVLLSDFAERWLVEKAPELAASTRNRYLGEIAHLISGLGDHYVDSLDVKDIRSWRNSMLDSAATATVNGRLRTAKKALDEAVAVGLLPTNPARHVKELRQGRTGGRRGNSLSVEEFRKVLGSIDALTAEGKVSEDIARMLLVLAWTGMRRGEMLALHWEDLRGEELFVRRSVFHGEAKETKTGEIRVVPVSRQLAEVLQAQRQWLLETQHPALATGIVFPAKEHTARAGARRRGDEEVRWYRSGSCLDAALRKVIKHAEVTEISIHGFRRTFENLMRASGVGDFVRRSVLGWKTDEAQRIYASVAPDERRAAAASMERFIAG